ncbi:hypothetical protein BDQ17DRAFT_985530 [Cyathus striatus]|nr:hypothetical protein BDQ17DRAFT_985530 [Cyathus striatus]
MVVRDYRLRLIVLLPAATCRITCSITFKALPQLMVPWLITLSGLRLRTCLLRFQDYQRLGRIDKKDVVDSGVQGGNGSRGITAIYMLLRERQLGIEVSICRTVVQCTFEYVDILTKD